MSQQHVNNHNHQQQQLQYQPQPPSPSPYARHYTHQYVNARNHVYQPRSKVPSPAYAAGAPAQFRAPLSYAPVAAGRQAGRGGGTAPARCDSNYCRTWSKKRRGGGGGGSGTGTADTSSVSSLRTDSNSSASAVDENLNEKKDAVSPPPTPYSPMVNMERTGAVLQDQMIAGAAPEV